MSRGRGARGRRTARRAAAAAEKTTTLIDVLEQRKDARTLRAIEDELAVSGSTNLPLGPRNQSWDGPAAAKAVKSWAGADDAPNAKYASAFFLKRDDGSKFGDYGLGFAQPVNGTLTANWGGITAVAGVLSGARGGVKGVSPADINGIKSRVGGYYSDAKKKYGDDDIKVPWQAANEAAVAYADERGLLWREHGGFDRNRLDEVDIVEFVAVQIAAVSKALAYAQLGPDAEPELLGMAASLWASQFAPMPDCANCDHSYADHLGTGGPCTNGDCDCNGYDEPDSDDDSATAETDELGVKVILMPGDYLARVTVAENGDAVFAPPTEWVEPELLAGNPGLGRFAPVDAPVEAGLPEQHKPGSRMPRRNPSPKTPATPAATAGPSTWSAILAPEGKLTSDGRAFAPGAITWRELPLTLMAMTETSEGGHVGAEVAGRVDDIWRDDKAGLIRASGIFDPGEYGTEIARMVGDETLRGNSVDLAIGRYVMGPRSDWFNDDSDWIGVKGDDGEWHPAGGDTAAEDDGPLARFDPDQIAVVMEAEIGMTTVCPFPAFAEAKIALGDSLVAGGDWGIVTVTQQGGWVVETCEGCVETIIASAAAEPLIGEGTAERPESIELDVEVITAAAEGLVPQAPPAEWFDNPQLDGPTPITVDDDGRISGHAATWGVCHIGFPSSCRTAPHSKSDYAYFHLGEVVCDDGSRISVGSITMDSPHADLSLKRPEATRHYDHTGTVVAHVRCGEDEHGIWVAGALQPDAPAEKVRLLRGAKLSGDWRKGELVALLAVNVPGFPIPRQRALAASAAGETEVLALVAAGIPVFESELSEDELARFAELAELAKAS